MGMRIACLHIPQFALQCATRIDPSLRGAAVVVVGATDPRARPFGDRAVSAALHSPIVQACSRAAWGKGARVGMTATAARALSPDLEIVTADAMVERETVRGLADVLLALSPNVDVGGRIGAGAAHLAMYCEVPSKTRGTTFGDRIHEKLEAFGLTARIGIADDRFTAWVAASSERPRRLDASADDEITVISVPRGGSAAFLAPRPLSLLAISPEVQHMLEALGVSTLGEFAALPAPSTCNRRPLEADYQALARGESGTTLRAYAPDAPIREDIAIKAPLSVPAATAVLAERIAMRLAGRGRW
jgi:protein ImuB